MTSILQDPDVPQGLRDLLGAGANVEPIRLDRRGRWWHQGESFENERIAALFHRSVVQTKAGNWLLEIPPYTYPITVDLTGRFVSRVEGFDKVLLLGEETISPDWTTLHTDNVDVIAIRVDGMWARLIGQAYRRIVEALSLKEDQWTTRLGDQVLTISVFPQDDPIWIALSPAAPRDTQ